MNLWSYCEKVSAICGESLVISRFHVVVADYNAHKEIEKSAQDLLKQFQADNLSHKAWDDWRDSLVKKT